MHKNDKSKRSINMESINLEDTAGRIESSYFWENLEGVRRSGAFCYM